MATIKIKRGLQEWVDGLVLAEGELAGALDTGNVYFGTAAGKVWLNPKGETAPISHIEEKATASALGHIRAGAGLMVDTDGVLSVNDVDGGTF